MVRWKRVQVSDTPRTDAEVESVKKACAGEYHLEGGEYVPTDFAKRLEIVLREILYSCEVRPGPFHAFISVPKELYERAKKAVNE
jgi:hypothetical protein